METLETALDESGNKVVVLPEIIFSNKQKIDWNEVEKYLERFAGELVEIAKTGNVIYLGKDFPDEYASSKYTRKTKGGRAKANVAQGIREMVGIASDKRFREKQKEKHSGDAANGWYYYTARFAMPVYDNDVKTENYNIYSSCLVVNCTGKGRIYLYGLVDIKKKRVTHSGLTDSQVLQNRLSLVKRIPPGRKFVNLFAFLKQGKCGRWKQPSREIIWRGKSAGQTWTVFFGSMGFCKRNLAGNGKGDYLWKIWQGR